MINRFPFFVAIWLSFAFSALYFAKAQPINATLGLNSANSNYPITLSVVLNERSDVSFIQIDALDEVNFADFDTKSFSDTYQVLPVNEKRLEIACAMLSDACFVPDGTTLLSFLTDSVLRFQRFEVNFLNANRQSVFSQLLEIQIPSDVPLAAPCSRAFLNLNTGVGVPDGQIDPNWTYSGNLPAYSFSFNYPAQSLNAKWINYFPHNGGYSNFVASFERKFCATAATPALLNFCVAADNVGKVYLNNVFVGQTTNNKYGFMYFACFNNIPVNLVAGANVLRVDVQNYEGSTGFILDNAWVSVNGSAGILGLNADNCCNPANLGKVVGQKVWDKNCNAIRDGGDVTLSGWTVFLTDPMNNTISTITDALGNYSFPNLLPGTYTVFESIQQGYSQSSSAGPYTVYVAPDAVVVRDFLNCKPPDCQELFSVNNVSEECCQSSFTVTNNSNSVLKSLSYNVIGGVINSVSAPCVLSTLPLNMNNSVSGTIFFDSVCTAGQPVTFFVNSTATTAQSDVCIEWSAVFSHGGNVLECKKVICSECPRMPLECFAKLDVAPNVFSPVNTDYRKFTVYNSKSPASQISHIDIAFVNPVVPHQIGGGLVVDGVNKIWTFLNSGGPLNAYSQIRLSCIPHLAVHGNPANAYVSFNLGVDNTLVPQYGGLVKLKIGYCDGDTCLIDYPWTPAIKNDNHNTLRVHSVKEDLRYVKLGVNLPDSAVSFAITIGDSNTKILASTAPVFDYVNNRELFAFNSYSYDNHSLYLVNGKDDSLGRSEQTVYLLFNLNEQIGASDVKIRVSYYDKLGKEIGFGESVASAVSLGNNSELSAKIQSLNINAFVVPNPSGMNSKLHLELLEDEKLSIVISNLNSEELIELSDNNFYSSGKHILDLPIEKLPSGTYFVIIKGNKSFYQTKFVKID